MMGIVFYRRFLVVAGLFLGVTLAAASLPDLQWWLIGAAWWLAMFIPGVDALRELGQRQQDEHQTDIL